MKNKILKNGLIAFFWIMYALPAMAQDSGNPGSGGIGDEDEYEGAPIDNWVAALLIIGILVGAYFYMKKIRTNPYMVK